MHSTDGTNICGDWRCSSRRVGRSGAGTDRYIRSANTQHAYLRADSRASGAPHFHMQCLYTPTHMCMCESEANISGGSRTQGASQHGEQPKLARDGATQAVFIESPAEKNMDRQCGLGVRSLSPLDKTKQVKLLALQGKLRWGWASTYTSLSTFVNKPSSLGMVPLS